jgi:hypothetical protein
VVSVSINDNGNSGGPARFAPADIGITIGDM